MRILAILLLVLSSNFMVAQSKKAMKEYQYARESARNRDYDRAMMHLNNALKSSPDYIEALVLKGDILFNQNRVSKASLNYKKALESGGPAYLNYKYGLSLMYNLEYEEAEIALNNYLSSGNVKEETRQKVEHYLENCEFGKKAVLNPVPFKPISLGEGVNDLNHQYHPSISIDGSTLVYTQQMTDGSKQDEDFYSVNKSNGKWGVGSPMEGSLNTRLNEGVQSLTADGNFMFYTICHREDGLGSCDLYVSENKGNGLWGPGVNLGENINTKNWESQPSISPDGRTLYFVRGVNSTSKSINIFYSEFIDGAWSKAEKLPETINTKKVDISPFIHFDNQTLYFASNGHPGMGEMDLFVSRKDENGEWGKPENIGYPINTPFEEFGLVVSADGKTAYYASNRLDSSDANMNIYEFELPMASRAKSVAWVKGRVTNKKTGKPLEATVEVVDLKKNKPWVSLRSDKNGHFFAVLPSNNNYGLNVEEKGFLFYSQNFELGEQSFEEAANVMVKLSPIEKGEKIILNNVFFENDSYELLDESISELNKLVDFMTENPDISIRIEGHTDNNGTDPYNLQLSKNRANSVQKFLISKGIVANRISTKGFGSTVPLATNDTEEGRRLNRRTEIIIL